MTDVHKNNATHTRKTVKMKTTVYHMDNLLLFCLFSLRDNVRAGSSELDVPKVCHISDLERTWKSPMQTFGRFIPHFQKFQKFRSDFRHLSPFSLQRYLSEIQKIHVQHWWWFYAAVKVGFKRWRSSHTAPPVYANCLMLPSVVTIICSHCPPPLNTPLFFSPSVPGGALNVPAETLKSRKRADDSVIGLHEILGGDTSSSILLNVCYMSGTLLYTCSSL